MCSVANGNGQVAQYGTNAFSCLSITTYRVLRITGARSPLWEDIHRHNILPFHHAQHQGTSSFVAEGTFAGTPADAGDDVAHLQAYHTESVVETHRVRVVEAHHHYYYWQ